MEDVFNQTRKLRLKDVQRCSKLRKYRGLVIPKPFEHLQYSNSQPRLDLPSQDFPPCAPAITHAALFLGVLRRAARA